MQEALLINFKSELLQQLKLEEGQNRITSSFQESLDWVNDAAVPLSGIYLNPNDSNFSGLQFLSEVMQKRPATPIYILDEAGDLSSQHFSSLYDKFKIKGVLRTHQELTESLKSLRIDLPPSLQALQERRNLKSEHPGYLAVPLMDFIYAKHFSANVFVEDTSKQLRFFAMEGSEVDLEYLSYLGKRTAWLFIEESTLESRMASFRLVDSAYLDPGYLSPSWRTAETMFRAKKFLSKLKENEISRELTGETFTVFQNLFQLTTELAQSVNLKNLIEQAKQSDRAIYSVILSVLLCKKLKYDTHSLVETLGVASLLQDLSLYRSPFGNIADADPNALLPPARAVYVNHPNLSADLVIHFKDVSELTQQIIRQQHERPDYTGFPAKVGGPQLQPLAEILSLINSYLDARANSEDFYSHYSERVTVPFRQIVAVLKNL